MFNLFENELNIKVDISSLDCRTRWSSCYNMIKNAYNVKRILNTTIRRIIDIDIVITNQDWEKCYNVCLFLESPDLFI